MEVQIEDSWKQQLAEEFSKPYFQGIVQKLREEVSQGKKICPTGKNIFKAFELTPFQNVKVVILGQDPYHGVGQAHGLCFSVPSGIAIPSSLQNIFKEIENDFQKKHHFKTGELVSWAKQGVLLLNSILTVRQHEPLSHQHLGWQTFTDTILHILSNQKENVVFMLWGNYAKQKQSLLDMRKHLVLTAAHPSGFSAHKGFFGCNHFSRANAFLKSKGLQEIDWFV